MDLERGLQEGVGSGLYLKCDGTNKATGEMQRGTLVEVTDV